MGAARVTCVRTAWFRQRTPRLPSRPHALALGGVVLVVVILLWKAVVAGEVFFDRDIHAVWHAQVEAFVRSVAAGSWPVWDPSVGFGQGLLANPNTQIFYPPNWTSLLLPAWVQYTLYSALHLMFAGLGLLYLARRHGCTWAGASTAAAVWMASGPLLSLLGVWHHFAGAAWLPWVLLAAERALDSRSVTDALIWGAATAGQLLAGSPDMFLLTGLLVAGLLALRLAASPPGERHVAARLFLAALAAVFCAGLAAAQWLPTLAAMLEAGRTSIPAAQRAVWSVHPWALPQLLVPIDLSWLPDVAPELTGPYQELWQSFVRSLYLGGPAACLAAAGAAAGRSRRLGALLVTVAAGALLYSLGGHTPFQGWAAAVVPTLGMLRYPSKFTIALAFAWSLLAGLGFDAVARGLSRRARLWLAAVALASCGLCLALLLIGRSSLLAVPSVVTGLAERNGRSLGLSAVFAAAAGASLLQRRLPAPRLAAALALVAVTELVVVNQGINPTTGSAFFRYRPEVLKTVGVDVRTRIYVEDYAVQIPGKATAGKLGVFLRGPGKWPRRVGNALAMQAYLYPPSFGRWGLSGSFDRDLLALYPKPLRDLADGFRYAEETPAFDRLLRLGGVDFVLALHEEGLAGLRPVATVPGLYPVPIRVYQVPGSLPRAYAVSGAERAGSPDAALRRLVDPGFDPSAAVLLEEGAPQASLGVAGEVRIVELIPDRVRLEATLRQPGFVVLLDSYDRGWQARVDGKQTSLLRANGVFRAVRVSPGLHSVELVYRPASLLTGLGVSAVTFLAGSGVLLRRLVQRA